jgi:RNA polymerase sigma factor (sigma-70 family)
MLPRARPQMVSSLPTDAELHELVAAARNDDTKARALLHAVLPELTAVVATVIAEVDGIQPRPGARALRDRILETVAAGLVDPDVLSRWHAAPVDRTWAFAVERARRLAVLYCDRALIERAMEDDRAAQAVLMQRIRRLFERAARRRQVPPTELEDELQEFYVWLIEGDHRNLRRWDPQGGMGFDRWFEQRSLNRVDSRRRRARLQVADGEPDEIGDPTDAQLELQAREQIDAVWSWLEAHGTPRQQELFIRWFLLDQSGATIAADLGMRTEAVHMGISRLRQALTRALES